MKRFINKIASGALLFGLVFVSMGCWKIYKERNVSSEPIAMEVGAISQPEGGLAFASITGGKLDITNMYEYSLTTKKSETKLTSNYYIPVMHPVSGDVAYIVKSSLQPTVEDILKDASYTGLLTNKSELPSKILTAYDEKYSGSKYLFLDSTYKAKSISEKILDLKLFFYLLFGGLVVLILVNRKPAKGNEEPVQ